MSRYWDDGERFEDARFIAEHQDEYDTVLGVLNELHEREGWT